MNCAKVGDAWLHVRPDLRAEGRNIVYINSLGSDLRIWDEVVVRLGAAGFGALRSDLRGHGLSDLGTPPNRIADHVADVVGVMDAFGVGKAAFCGLSVGGAIAMGLAQAAPQRVERLALCCTSVKFGGPEVWNPRIAAVEQGGVAAVAEDVLRRWFPPAVHETRAPLVAMVRNMLSRTYGPGYAATAVALRDSDLTEAARGIKVAALCLAGTGDASTPPEVLRGLAALIPGAVYTEIEGAGHLPCLQEPEAFADRLLAFLK